MNRTFEDRLGTTWDVLLLPAGDVAEDVDEEMTLRFTAEGTDDRDIRVRGPVEERFRELSARDLELAVEAAGNEVGFLFLHPEGHLWWVRDAAEDELSDGSQITFSDLEDEHHYPGALASRPREMSEDELQEILDDVRGITSP